MEKTKKFMHVCIGIALIISSLSLLIFSAKDHKAIAQESTILPDGTIVAGTIMMGTGFSADYYVLGYNPKDGKVSVLGKISPKDIRK